MLADHGVAPSQVSHVGHGTTVATNLIIERKGARVGLITTRGFRDVLEIGRQTRPHLYDYSVGKPPVAVPREFRAEVDERVSAAGDVLTALDEAQVRDAARRFAIAGIEAVTICFLHAYRNPAHERRAAQIVAEEMPDAYISQSSDVLPEFREYERLSTTVLNAAVGPKMARYLERFLNRVRELDIGHEPHTIHSNGGLMSIATVRQYPVRTCLSGPAAGVVGAAAVGRAIGTLNLVTFDVHVAPPRRRVPGQDTHGRHPRHRRGRRQHRLAGRRRCAEGRAAQRGRGARPRGLRPRRPGTHHHGRRDCAAAAQPGGALERPHAGVCGRRPRGHPQPCR
jgi:N-methylhydantoinase A